MTAAYSYLTAFLATAVLVVLLAPLARRIGLVDAPKGHKTHEGEVPLVGGIAIFCGFLFAILTPAVPLAELKPLFAGAALLVIVGVLDDFHELRPHSRFIAQIAAATMMTLWGDVRLENLGGLTGPEPILLGPWAVPFTVFSVVGVINATNMQDGADGLAGGLVLIALVVLAAVAAGNGLATSEVVLLALAAGVLGFLTFNLRLPWRPRARVFMGDAGSMFLGFCLAWFLVELSQSPGPDERPALAPVTALWIVAVPLMDTVTIMLRRILRGRSPFKADREHLHHLLRRLGLSVSTTVAAILAATALLAAIGLWAERAGIDDSTRFAAFAGLFVVYFFALEGGWRVLRPRGRESAAQR